MSHAYALRSSASGPQFDGNPGDVLTMQSDGRAKFEPGGGAGAIVPLTLEFWVDSGRVGSTQDGSIAQPFLSIQAGLDFIVASGAGRGSLLVADGDYSGEELTCPIGNLSIIATGNPITVALLGTDIAPFPGVRLYNVFVAAESFLVGGNTHHIERGGLLGAVDMGTGAPRLEAVDATIGDVTCLDTAGTLSFRSCEVGGVIGAEGGFHAALVEAWDTHFSHGIDAEDMSLRVCTVDQSINGQRATLEQSTVQEAHIINTLTADTFSLGKLRIGASSSDPTQTTVSDHSSTLAVCTVPAIEQGSFADVTISGIGFFAKEGDCVVTCMGNDVAIPRLANVGIANAWISPAGDVVLRFFGTTAGGSQLVNLALIPATATL